MDPKNLFHTPTTYRLVRAEYLVGLAVAFVLALIHFGEIRWLPFVALFVYIDVIGYLPGVIAHHREEDRLPAARLLRALQHDAQPDHRRPRSAVCGACS